MSPLHHTNRIKSDSECSFDFPPPTPTNANVLKGVEFPAEGLLFAERKRIPKENVFSPPNLNVSKLNEWQFVPIYQK